MYLLADLHLREESEATVLGQVLPDIRQSMEAGGETDLAILGDVLTFRYKIDARLQNALLDELRAFGALGMQVHIVPGNHDQYDVHGRNALEPLGELPNVALYTHPESNRWGHWLPYRKSVQDIQRIVQNFRATPNTPAVIFGHVGVMGARMNDSVIDGDGVSAGTFDGFVTILGHYHRAQTIEPCSVTYVGSPYQTKADESGSLKGYGTWDGSRYFFHPMDWGKRYHRWVSHPTQVLDLHDVRPEDEVRVTVPVGDSVERVTNELRKAGCTNFVVTPEVEAQQDRLDVAPSAELSDYVQAYVAAHCGQLESARLLSLFEELTHARE